MRDLDVVALPMGECTFRPDDPDPAQTGVVVASAIRHEAGVFVFRTGSGIGGAGRGEPWTRRCGYPCRAVLGGELAVPCTCNPLQQG